MRRILERAIVLRFPRVVERAAAAAIQRRGSMAGWVDLATVGVGYGSNRSSQGYLSTPAT